MNTEFLFKQIKDNIITFNQDLLKLIAEVASLKKSQQADSEIISSMNIQFESMNKALAATNVFTSKRGKKEISRKEVFAYLIDFPEVAQTMLFEKPDLLSLW